MSDHDVLMSNFISLKKQLEQYIEQYAPEGGEDSLIALTQAMKEANDFPERSN
jgi:hypothetical protein